MNEKYDSMLLRKQGFSTFMLHQHLFKRIEKVLCYKC